MNPLAKFTSKIAKVPLLLKADLTNTAPKGKSALMVVMDETKNPPVLSSEYVAIPVKCSCKVCKIHASQPKAYVCATKMVRFGNNLVWICLDCASKIQRDPKVEIPEVSAILQAPYTQSPSPPSKPATAKLPFKKLTK